MGKQTKVLVIVFVVLVILLAALFGFSNFQKADTEQTTVEDSAEGEALDALIDVSIDYGDEDTVANFPDLSIEAGNSLFSVLDALSQEGKIDLQYKDFGGELGVFIEAIDGVGLESSDNRWWQYFVNGNYGEIGVSNFVPKNGDSVLFKYTESQQ